MQKKNFKISLVVPCFNEALNIEGFYQNIINLMSSLATSYEIIFINDGSKDHTLDILSNIHKVDPRTKIIDLSRNFGKEAALTAGLDHTTGDVIIPLDADFQDPPELITQMLDLWKLGYEVVLATRRDRDGETLLKKLTAKLFYRLFSKLSKTPLPENTGDFRLMDKRVVEKIRLLREKNRFMKGIFAWVGFRTTQIFFDRPKRKYGQTSWNYKKLYEFALDGILSFSTFPLKIWLYLGLLISIISFAYALYLIIKTMIFGIDLPGYASIMVSILFMGGVQLISLGIIGEYIGRIYKETKDRPIYIVNKIYDESKKEHK